MAKPTKDQIVKWVQALESGKYKQGRNKLQTGKDRYCCLGVACVVFIPEKKLFYTSNSKQTIKGYGPCSQPNAPKWLQEISGNVSLKLGGGISLVTLNDVKKFTFSEICTVLELLYIHKALN